ncbi:MAG: hypothetical protein ACTHKT_08000 [Solirubrobacterales bacterium]
MSAQESNGGEAEKDDEQSGTELGRPPSVELLLGFLRDVAFADESDRQQHLDTKAGTLAGFVAIALSLEAGLGASVLLDQSINCGVRALFIFFFVVAVLALAASGLFSLLGVLAPKDYLALDDSQIEEMSTRAEMQRPANEIREKQLATLADLILHARTTDNRKARFLKLSSVALAVAVAAIAAQGLTLPFG